MKVGAQYLAMQMYGIANHKNIVGDKTFFSEKYLYATEAVPLSKPVYISTDI